MITVFFRYDDFSAVSPAHVDSGLINTFRRHGMSCTFAVIPAVTEGDYHEAGDRQELPLAGEKLELLRQAVRDGVVDIALHGWNHRTNSASPPPNPSEFCGLTPEQQACRLRRGANFFQQTMDVTPAVFVPPWNTYDKNTLRALEDAGILGISAHRYSPCIQSPMIRYLPMTIEIRDLRDAIRQGRRSSGVDSLIGVMMHPYDFCESGDPRCSLDLAGLERELTWLRECPDVDVKTLGGLASSGRDFGVQRFRDNRPSRLENIFPPFVRKTYQLPVYLASASARRTGLARLSATLLFHLIVALLSLVAGGLLLAALPMGNAVVMAAQAVVALGIVLLVARGLLARGIYFRAMTILSGLGGLLAGSLL